MNNKYYAQMFNPQYVNSAYYHQLQRQHYENAQSEEVGNAVKAFRDLIEATKKLDPIHQQIAFEACLAEMARQCNW